MGENDPPLDGRALATLRETVKSIRQEQGRSVPWPKLLDLAAAAPLGAGITIDLEASQDIGHELIVVRMPAPPSPSAEAAQGDERLALLSRRELEVAELMAAGLTNRQIADRLFIAGSTAKDHVHKIFQKTGFPNRTAVAAALHGRRR
jgi:DNA-binding NarL/FixJ family response regulator